MTTLAEQVAEVKVGDWVEARFEYDDGNFTITGGKVTQTNLGMCVYGERYFCFADGTPDEHLTSIHRVPRPIPSEPGFGHFALLKVDGDFDIAKNYRGAEYEDRWAKFAQDEWHSWPEVYPLIIRLYTPSGDLVEGFEYAGGSK